LLNIFKIGEQHIE